MNIFHLKKTLHPSTLGKKLVTKFAELFYQQLKIKKRSNLIEFLQVGTAIFTRRILKFEK